MNHRTVLFLILLLGFRNSFTTVVSAIILKSPDTDKKIILLEDIHNGMEKDFFDPLQREHLGKFLHDLQEKTHFILELPIENLKILSLFYKKLYFYSWILRKMSYLSRNFPIVSLRDPECLIQQLFVDSVDNKKAWQNVKTITTADTRNHIDMAVCLIIQNLFLTSPKAITQKPYREIVANKEHLNYNTDDPTFAEVKKTLFPNQLILLLQDISDPIMLLLKGLHPRITVSRYNNRLAELDKEFDTRITSLAKYNFITNEFIATLKQKKAAIIRNAHAVIEPYIKKNNCTLPQVIYKIFKKQKSFDNAFPALEALEEPAMFLSDLGFLQRIADGIISEKTKNIVLLAGLSHTLNVEDYLKQLGYYVSTELPLITISKKEEEKEHNLTYWPFLTLLDNDDLNDVLEIFRSQDYYNQ